MKKINPKNYEYLWSNHEIDFIFASCYLFEEFRACDIVLTYDHVKKELKFFLSTREKKRLSKENVQKYLNEFETWNEHIGGVMERGREIIAQSRGDGADVSEFPMEQLKERFVAAVRCFQDLGNAYLRTEFFTQDEIERMAQKETQAGKILKERLEKTAHIKLAARGILNSFYDYDQVFRPYVEEIAARTGRDDIRWLSFHEIIDLAEGKSVGRSDRHAKYWVLAQLHDWNFLSGNEAKDILDRFDAQFFKTTEKKVKGMVARKGVYRGTARILRTLFSADVRYEIAKVQKGDVLIANTTGPEVMEACQRAGAIITDEGGIASHAAIVSRELGIPCIVGTKTATKTFADGDLVEVDADIGVARIVEP